MAKFQRAREGQVFRLNRADDSHRLNIRAMIHLAASSTTPRQSIPDSSSRMSILTRRMFRYDFLIHALPWSSPGEHSIVIDAVSKNRDIRYQKPRC